MLSYDGWVAISSNLANWWPNNTGPISPFTWDREAHQLTNICTIIRNNGFICSRSRAPSKDSKYIPFRAFRDRYTFFVGEMNKNTACCKQDDGITLASWRAGELASWRQTADESTSLWVCSTAFLKAERQRKWYLGFMLLGMTANHA